MSPGAECSEARFSVLIRRFLLELYLDERLGLFLPVDTRFPDYGHSGRKTPIRCCYFSIQEAFEPLQQISSAGCRLFDR